MSCNICFLDMRVRIEFRRIDERIEKFFSRSALLAVYSYYDTICILKGKFEQHRIL